MFSPMFLSSPLCCWSRRLMPSLMNNTCKFIQSFIHQWRYSPLLGPGLFFSFVIFFTQTVGLLGRVISPSQGRYLYTGQHRHRIDAHTPHTDIHTFEWDSNPRSQRSSAQRQFIPQTARPLWSATRVHFTSHIHIKGLSILTEESR
jgi:hypothetical protein